MIRLSAAFITGAGRTSVKGILSVVVSNPLTFWGSVRIESSVSNPGISYLYKQLQDKA